MNLYKSPKEILLLTIAMLLFALNSQAQSTVGSTLMSVFSYTFTVIGALFTTRTVVIQVRESGGIKNLIKNFFKK